MLTVDTGSRGGKRSVTHLSKAQLERKRANDREAQRNIRQRTKEHIESLEAKVKELEQGCRASSMERILKRNRELEEEIAKLRAQLQAPQASPAAMEKEHLIPQKGAVDWMPGSTPSQWPASHISTLNTNAELQASSTSFIQAQSVYSYPATSPSVAYDETSPQLYTPNLTPIEDDAMAFGSQPSQGLSKQSPAWSPFHPAFAQPARFSGNLQQSGFDELMNHQASYNSTSWQSQPSIYAWQISTKLKAPVTYVDQLMLSVINSQRHLAITADLTGEDLVGASFPSVNVLFNQPGPVNKKPSSMTEMMERYAELITSRGFTLIPERLASFMCMYRFVQWQINPAHETYQALHEWQAPRPSQLSIPHPAWMDLPPWGSFRSKIIENQGKYDTVEFQNDYATNLRVNFPLDPMKAFVFENGKIMVSEVMHKHLSDINNMSMKKAFAVKYPEFNDVCRFEDVA